MKRLIDSGTGIVRLIVVFAFTSAVSAAGYNPERDPGSPGQDNVYQRVVTISPYAKWVNVNRDETIKFIDASSAKSFVWNFNTYASRIDLSKVAPAGVLAVVGLMLTLAYRNAI